MKTEVSKNVYAQYTVTYESPEGKIEKVTVTTEVAAKSKEKTLIQCGAANVKIKSVLK